MQWLYLPAVRAGNQSPPIQAALASAILHTHIMDMCDHQSVACWLRVLGGGGVQVSTVQGFLGLRLLLEIINGAAVAKSDDPLTRGRAGGRRLIVELFNTTWF